MLNFGNARKNIIKTENLFVIVFYSIKRKCSQIELQLKVEIEKNSLVLKYLRPDVVDFYLIIKGLHHKTVKISRFKYFFV